MNLRKVSIRDYRQIKNLFVRNGLEIISVLRWKNLWKQNPVLKNEKKWTKGWVIEEKKKIVGHFGSFPAKYVLNNKPYLCSVLYGWVVDKKFRSQSILLLKKIFSQTNVDFFLGTTTNKPAGKIMNALNAKQIPLKSLGDSLFVILNLKKTLKFIFEKKVIPFKSLLINLLTIIFSLMFKTKLNQWKAKFSRKNIIMLKKIDSNFNYLWKKTKHIHKNKLLFQRDENSLEWHLGYFLKIKKAWIMINVENKKITGYAICIQNKNYTDNLKRAFLIDLITFEKGNKVPTKLIASCIYEAKKRNCDIFECRGFDNESRSYMNFCNPFKKKLSHNTFYYKSNNNKLNKLLNKSNCWNTTQIDGDAILNF